LLVIFSDLQELRQIPGAPKYFNFD